MTSKDEDIHVRALKKRFGDVVALDGVDLDVRRGEIVALLGPNGAGKSTLLRILGTLVLPDSGKVRVGGVDAVSDSAAVRKRIGILVGDERSFYWRLSGYENLRFFAALYGMHRREAAARAEALLNAVGLADAARRRTLGYSSGMRARLLLARALLTNPDLLLLDEPTRTLDPLAASQFRDVATRLAREHGAGILYATHDLHEAAATSDHVVVLSAGRVVLRESVAGMDASRLESVFLAAVREHGDTLDLRADELIAAE